MKDKVLLVSHELSLTGAPMVLFDLALCLRELGYEPITVSIHSQKGPLAESYEKEGMVLLTKSQKEIYNLIKNEKFKCVFLNTFVCYELAEKLDHDKIFWWVHESEFFYKSFPHPTSLKLRDSVKVFAGGLSAQSNFAKLYPSIQVELLLYGIYNKTESFPLNLFNKEKINFICAGSLEKRKGQDLLVDAVNALPENLKELTNFYFIGKSLDSGISQKITQGRKNGLPITYIDVLEPSILNSLIKDADCLISPALDDPLPVVVALALSFGTRVIIPSNSAYNDFLKNTNTFNLKFEVGERTVETLTSCITKCCEEKGLKKDSESQRIFEQNFSRTAFRQRIKKMSI